MMKSFQFAPLPAIIFRPGALGSLPSRIKLFGKRTIIVTGGRSLDASGKTAFILGMLKDEGISFNTVKISGEPSPDDIDNIVALLKHEKYDCVVGIGGGSVLDAGKAVSAMMYMDASVTEFLEGIGTREHPGTKLPFIAVPTTSGTGSEATKNAVISKTGVNGFKRSLRHDNFIPDTAIVDPELTATCPPAITAAGGMDCFTQLTESYLSDKSCDYTDALSVEGIKAVKSSLLRCFNNGSDAEARAGMSFAALTSGICLANAGLGAVHGFASSIGGRYNIPHGVICGTLMAAVNEITVRKLRQQAGKSDALSKYAKLGKLFSDGFIRSDDYLIDSFVENLKKLSEELHLPLLNEIGVEETDLAEIAKTTDCKNNPAKLTAEELQEILESRFK